MHLIDIWQTPWRTTHRPARLFMLAILVLCCAGAVPVGIFSHEPDWWLGVMVTCSFGIGFVWAFLMPSLLLVAIDARQLRVPGVSSTVVASILAYAMVSIVVPTVVLAALGAPTVPVALIAAMVVSVGLAIALLPRYVSMVIGFLPALCLGLQHVIPFPQPGAPRFVVWGVCALVVLVAVDIVRWRQLLLAEQKPDVGLGSAMVLTLRGNGGMGNWRGLSNQDANPGNRRTQCRMQISADLRGVGPGDPLRTLSTALGGWYVPQTGFSYARQTARILLPMLAFVLLMTFMEMGEVHGGGLHQILLMTGALIIGWFGIFGGVMLAILTASALRQRWSRVNAELPLLALLPRLGDAADVRQHLLRAALGKPLRAQLLLLVLVVVTALLMRLGSTAVAFVTLAQVGCAGMIVATTLSTFGRRELPGWGTALLFCVAFLLVGVSTFLPMFAIARHPWHMSSVMQLALALAWVVFGLMLFWLGRRGWRELQQLPHPFLAN